ncbi:MAG: hypothetical protein IT541_15685 [Hyphomicrobiales bacterium]|nr:hypothetical protein [Hyphomicrobiales bacterium]
MADKKIDDLPPHIRQQAAQAARESGVAKQAAGTMQEATIESKSLHERQMETQKEQQRFERNQQQDDPTQKR